MPDRLTEPTVTVTDVLYVRGGAYLLTDGAGMIDATDFVLSTLAPPAAGTPETN
jgi:hypothetical protein